MIPFLDLEAQYRSLQPELEEAVLKTLRSGRYVLGPEVEGFEREFAAFCRVRHAVGVNSGTSALHLALLALGVGPGDEVVTVPFTFVATVAAILYTGAKPVLVDVDPVTYNMDPAGLAAALTPRTKAVIPVHLHGRPVDMDPILKAARAKGAPVVEDAAQAHGAEDRGRRVGSLGDLACFSFYPGKNLGACGEGGAVVTDNPEWARTVRMLRDFGSEKKYQHELRGYNYRLEALQAAALRVKLRRLDAWTEGRRRIAALYDRELAGSGVQVPATVEGQGHVYHVYGILCRDREKVRRALEKKGIQTNIHYPVPVHLQEAYAGLGYKAGDFPVSESLAQGILSLPLYPELKDAQVREVAAAVREAAGA